LPQQYRAQFEQLPTQGIISSAGQDAVCMAHVAPSAMILVPYVGGISRNQIEDAKPENLTAGLQPTPKGGARLLERRFTTGRAGRAPLLTLHRSPRNGAASHSSGNPAEPIDVGR
jgi:hypothetical protein